MKVIYALLALLFAASCTLVERERGYPGGNIGYAADKYTLFAQGHSQRVDRYLISLALLAPIVAETADTPTEAKLSAERIEQLYRKLLKLKEVAKKCPLTKKRTSCSVDKFTQDDEKGFANSQTALNFEAVSYEVAESLVKIARQGLENLQIETRLTSFAKLSPTDMLNQIARVRHLVPLFLEYFANYRDTTLILASTVPSCEDPKVLGKHKEACKKINKAQEALVERQRKTNSEGQFAGEPLIKNLFEAFERYNNNGGYWKLEAPHVAALMVNLDRVCLRLEKIQEIDEDEDDISKCASRKVSPARELFGEYKKDVGEPLSALADDKES